MCDEPHPLLIKEMIGHCTQGKIDEAYKIMAHLWQLGYSPEDIITSIFRVCKVENMPEYLKLEFIKVIVVCKQSLKIQRTRIFLPLQSIIFQNSDWLQVAN